VSLDQLRAIKKETGGMSDDVAHLVEIAERVYIHPAEDLTCEGFAYQTFAHSHDDFQDTNNLSLVIYVELFGHGILFPGDLEKAGWQAMLRRGGFRAILPKVNVFVASHHGRENGKCSDVFYQDSGRLCRPHYVVFSDKSIIHDTQDTHAFYHGAAIGGPFGPKDDTRYVLTTRNDGRIAFRFDNDHSWGPIK
jgi:hypothetical protein